MKYLSLILMICLTLFSQNKIDSLKAVIKSGSQNIEAKFQLAKIYHDEVAGETGDYTDEAEALFKEILEEKRDHAVARVYYGSLLTLKGRDAFLPWKKMSFVEEGCDEMDKAVKIDPNNIEIRMARSMNNINLPGFFNRITYCLEDFKFLRTHKGFDSFTKELKQQILYYNAKALMNNDEEIEGVKLYQQVVAIDGNTRLGKKAQEIISE